MAVVSSGAIIQDTDFNNLRNRIAAIMGTGSGTTGYGQALASVTVAQGTVIDADHYNGLFTDITKAYAHQFGSLPTTLANVAVGDIIGANSSDGTSAAYQGINDIDAVLITVESNPLRSHSSQMTNEAKINNSRTSAWNGTIDHQVTVTFNDANHRRYFFNTGGEIRLRAGLTGGLSATAGTKDYDWRIMLSNMGTFKMSYNTTTVTGSGSGSAVGDRDLTTSNQLIGSKSGSGVYAENRYYIYARAPSSNQLLFTIQFQDNDIGDDRIVDAYTYRVDENVTGTLTSYVDQYRATGSYVSVASPGYLNSNTL